MIWGAIGKALVFLFLIVVIAGGGYYIGTRNSAQPTPTPVQTIKIVDDSNNDVSGTPSPTNTAAAGKITGKLGFPSEHIPPMTVYALNTKNAGDNFFVKTGDNQGSFTIEDVEPGTYHVVAYVDGSNSAGGWTKSVPCGLTVDCKDHALLDVEVKIGETTGGVEVRDWYAPEGSFPVKPQ